MEIISAVLPRGSVIFVDEAQGEEELVLSRELSNDTSRSRFRN